MSAPRIAVVGAGQMGAQHARVVGSTDLAELAVVVDADADRAEQVASPYGAPWSTDPEAALDADAVIVATPTEHHVSTALEFIRAGKPMLVEKPVAETVEDTAAVVSASEAAGTPLMCGFVERHNPAVVTALGLLEDPIIHAVALRHSPPAPRIRTSVVWDLLVHDLDLAWRLARGSIAGLKATGYTINGSLEIADCGLQVGDGGLITLSSSRAGQRKLRSWYMVTQNVMVEIDLVRQDVTSYRHVTHTHGQNVAYRAETVVDIPFVRHGGEPLELQLGHYVRLINGHGDVEQERSSIMPAHELASEVARELASAPA